ncbi:RTA1-domain-containing protein, partial [Mycena latifolia]
AMYYKVWWLLPTAVICGIGEILGWSARLWSSITPTANDPYLIQLSTTVIAPTPLLAANFIILSRIVQQLGPAYSWLTPQWYTLVFLPCDVIALVVQGVGGGLASSATDLAAQGAHIVLGGIVFQFVVITFYSTLGVDFLWRYLSDRPTPRNAVGPTPHRPHNIPQNHACRTRLLHNHPLYPLYSLFFSNTLIARRSSIYRIIELSTGWTGRIIQTEVYFNVLDGTMIVFAIYTLNVAHPDVLPARKAMADGLELKEVPPLVWDSERFGHK